MTPKDKARRLREIVEVRSVQQQAAELKVAQANLAISRLTARETQQQEALRKDQDQWRMALGAHSLSLPLVRAWSAAIRQGEVELGETGHEIEFAQSEKADRSQAWQRASASNDAAKQMFDRAQAADRRRLEEVRLNDIADRFAHRVAPW